MDEKFIQHRIRQLRKLRRLPANEMSLAMEQNASYVSHIETGKKLPSWPAFFAICRQLHVTPQEFFDEGNADPFLQDAIVGSLKKLDLGKRKALMIMINEFVNG